MLQPHYNPLRTSRPLTPAIGLQSLSKPFPIGYSGCGGSTGGIGGKRPGGVSCCMASLDLAGMGGRRLAGQAVLAGGSLHR